MKRLTGLTRVGWFQIPVVNAEHPSIATFSSGARGRHERGDFCFWTAVLKTPVRLSWARRAARKNFGRVRLGCSPGDRFDRMKHERKTSENPTDRAVYHAYWVVLLRRGRNVSFIRPSTLREIKLWKRTHASDWRYFKRLIMNGKIVRTV